MSAALDARFPLQHAVCSHGRVAWREAGAGMSPPGRPKGEFRSAQHEGSQLSLVLLHGIGAGALSWAGQFAGLAGTHRVIAWDAPGYGSSAPLPQTQPMAVDYARALGEWLGQLGVTELVLVGHSLGALMAAAWAAQAGERGPQRLRSLVLASPARGYGSAAPATQLAKWQERIELMARLGPAGLAEQRSASLCAGSASPAALALVRWSMARTTPGGYGQAAHMLAHDDLATHLRGVLAPMQVLCGDLDQTTPAAACRELAAQVGAPFTLLEGVAHACYVEDAPQFNAALRQALSPPVTTATRAERRAAPKPARIPSGDRPTYPSSEGLT